MDDVKIFLTAIGAIIFLPLTWVWSIARSARSCAYEARADTAKQGVEVKDLSRRIGELREEQRDHVRPGTEDPGLLVHAALPGDFRNEETRNQVAWLSQCA